jgi:hypothetical protein
MDSLMRIKSYGLAKKTIQMLCTNTGRQMERGRKLPAKYQRKPCTQKMHIYIS